MSQRTLASLLTKTLIIRLVALLSHTFLLIVRKRKATRQSAAIRLLLYTLIPFTSIVDYCGDLYSFYSSCHQSFRQQSLRCLLLQLANYHIPLQSNPEHTIPLRKCHAKRIKKHQRSPERLLLTRISRVAQLLVSLCILAVMVVALVLVLRRIVLVLHSWLNLDWWNGVAALGGAMAAFLSICINAASPVRRYWTCSAAVDRDEKEPRDQPHDITKESGLFEPALLFGSYCLTTIYANYQYLGRTWMKVVEYLFIQNLAPWQGSQHAKSALGIPFITIALILGFIRYRKLPPTSALFWLCFIWIPMFDLYYQYGPIVQELRHIRLNYQRNIDHNWTWMDELTARYHIY